MSRFKQFTVSAAKKMPVIILADISGSMSVDGKIETLNRAIAQMIASFAEEVDVRADIYVSVITFGKGGAKIHMPLQEASQIQWHDMEAVGSTPMAAAFELVASIVEDTTQIASRDYHPNIVLVSDGQPTDERGHLTDNWKPALEKLLKSPRASKALHLAMGIGADADYEVLKEFVQHQQQDVPVFRADETHQIRQFFNWLTMSVTNRSRSANPNTVSVIDFGNVEDIVF
ncbi:VWA domain-containing protein [Anabaena minutissima FACHB-250]|nr:VWA domain-containing protein [Anabaena minutissima FACHB-250]